jgi:hypothetical protein
VTNKNFRFSLPVTIGPFSSELEPNAFIYIAITLQSLLVVRSGIWRKGIPNDHLMFPGRDYTKSHLFVSITHVEYLL